VQEQRRGQGRLTVSQTAELLDLSVYDMQQKEWERGIELKATAEQYRQALEMACQLRPQRNVLATP
jgi:predicted HTH domain antitoxin